MSLLATVVVDALFALESKAGGQQPVLSSPFGLVSRLLSAGAGHERDLPTGSENQL